MRGKIAGGVAVWEGVVGRGEGDRVRDVILLQHRGCYRKLNVIR